MVCKHRKKIINSLNDIPFDGNLFWVVFYFGSDYQIFTDNQQSINLILSPAEPLRRREWDVITRNLRCAGPALGDPIRRRCAQALHVTQFYSSDRPATYPCSQRGFVLLNSPSSSILRSLPYAPYQVGSRSFHFTRLCSISNRSSFVSFIS